MADGPTPLPAAAGDLATVPDLQSPQADHHSNRTTFHIHALSSLRCVHVGVAAGARANLSAQSRCIRRRRSNRARSHPTSPSPHPTQAAVILEPHRRHTCAPPEPTLHSPVSSGRHRRACRGCNPPFQDAPPPTTCRPSPAPVVPRSGRFGERDVEELAQLRQQVQVLLDGADLAVAHAQRLLDD